MFVRVISLLLLFFGFAVFNGSIAGEPKKTVLELNENEKTIVEGILKGKPNAEIVIITSNSCSLPTQGMCLGCSVSCPDRQAAVCHPGVTRCWGIPGTPGYRCECARESSCECR